MHKNWSGCLVDNRSHLPIEELLIMMTPLMLDHMLSLSRKYIRAMPDGTIIGGTSDLPDLSGRANRVGHLQSAIEYIDGSFVVL